MLANVRSKTAHVLKQEAGHVPVLYVCACFPTMQHIVHAVIIIVYVLGAIAYAGSKAAHVLGKDTSHVPVPHVCGVMDWSCKIPRASTSQQAQQCLGLQSHVHD